MAAHKIIYRVALLGLALTFTLDALAQPSSPDRPTPDPCFGAIEAFWMPDAAYAANLGWERILFDWSQLQPDGPDDWDGLNVRREWLQNARDAEREIVGIIKNSPGWATDGAPHSGVPRGLYLPVDDPGNLWAVFVRRVSEVYAPQGVHRWIIWNEPDISAETYGHEFEGSVEDYYQLVKVAYQALHEVDQTAKVHLAGLTYWHDPTYLGRFLAVVKADPEAPANDYFFDVVSLHIYFQSETVFNIISETKDIMRMRGIEKPIWLNETNASPNLDPAWPIVRARFQITLEQQADYIIQASALALAAGAERIGIYKFADGYLPEGAESFGLIRADGSHRPGYTALKIVATHFAGVTDARLNIGRRAIVVTLTLPEERTAYVLWARSDQPVTAYVAARADDAVLIDVEGNEKSITPGTEGYELTLAAASCTAGEGCPVGGAPLILIQAGPPAPVTFVAADAPRETLDTTHPPTPTRAALPTLHATPGATATLTRTPRPTLTRTP